MNVDVKVVGNRVCWIAREKRTKVGERKVATQGKYCPWESRGGKKGKVAREKGQVGKTLKKFWDPGNKPGKTTDNWGRPVWKVVEGTDLRNQKKKKKKKKKERRENSPRKAGKKILGKQSWANSSGGRSKNLGQGLRKETWHWEKTWEQRQKDDWREKTGRNKKHVEQSHLGYLFLSKSDVDVPDKRAISDKNVLSS